MSRTRKDRPSKIRYPRYWDNVGDKPKQPKHVNTEWHWLGSTPSSWTRLMMNRPMRHRGRAWEQQVLRELDLKDTDPPGVSRKPHHYYW